LASLEAARAALKRLENAVDGAIWRLLCHYSSPLSEHEARQILRKAQEGAKRQKLSGSGAEIKPIEPPGDR